MRGTVEKRTGTASRAYEVTGFVKAFHGINLHGVLVLPALVWCLSRTSLSEATRCRRLVATAIGCYLLTAIAVLGFDLVTRTCVRCEGRSRARASAAAPWVAE